MHKQPYMHLKAKKEYHMECRNAKKKAESEFFAIFSQAFHLYDVLCVERKLLNPHLGNTLLGKVLYSACFVVIIYNISSTYHM